MKANLANPAAVGHVNPLGNVLSLLIGSAGEMLTARLQAIIALVFELCIVGLMVAFEALGHTGQVAAAPIAPPERAVPPRKRLTRSTALVVTPNPRQQAAQFGVSCFRPDPTAELPLVRIPSRYKLWCEERGYAALPPDTIANELRGLFDKAGLMIEKRGNDLVVCGLALAE